MRLVSWTGGAGVLGTQYVELRMQWASKHKHKTGCVQLFFTFFAGFSPRGKL